MNIEQLFLSFDPNDDSFPQINGRDYIAIYKNLKSYFDTYIHPEIKTKILEIEKEGYYNDHGIDHIRMVINRVSRLIYLLNPTFNNTENEKFYISPYEIFILLVAINLHDSGHLISSRAEHARKGKELLAKFDTGNLLGQAEKKIIGDIAKVHGGKDDPIGTLADKQSISHKNIRPQFLAALLRLADELAEDSTRASQFLLKLQDQRPSSETHNYIEPTSEIFHRFSASLDSIDIDQSEITLHFYISENLLHAQYPKKDKDGTINSQYLVDEIYGRTVKTFTEALYCSRFFPTDLRFSNVKASISLLSEFGDDVVAPIKFVLKETGYPTLMSGDIFELCKSDLKTPTGQKKDGAYISNLIKSNLPNKNEEPI